MRQILSSITRPIVSNYLTTDTPEVWLNAVLCGEQQWFAD